MEPRRIIYSEKKICDPAACGLTACAIRTAFNRGSKWTLGRVYPHCFDKELGEIPKIGPGPDDRSNTVIIHGSGIHNCVTPPKWKSRSYRHPAD